MNHLPSHQEHQSAPARRGIGKRLAGLLGGRTTATETPAAPRQEARVSPETFAAKMQQVEYPLPDLGLQLTLTGEADAIFKQQKEHVQKQLLARVAIGDTEELQSIRKLGFTSNRVYALAEALEQRFGKKVAIKELDPTARMRNARGSDLKGQFQAMQLLAAKQTERYPDGIEGVFRFAEVYGYMKQTPTDERPPEKCKEWLIMERIEGDHVNETRDPFDGVTRYITLTDEQASLSRIAAPDPKDIMQGAVSEERFQDAVAERLASEDAGIAELKSMLHDLGPHNMLVETRPDGTTGFVAIDMGHPDAPEAR